jgi:hypothetical protein
MPDNQEQWAWLESRAGKLGFNSAQEMCMDAIEVFNLLGAMWRLAHSN